MMTVVAVLGITLVPVALLLAVVDAIQRRRDHILSRQVMLTDAVHAELGAVVAPFVEKHAFRPWRVVFRVAEPHGPEIGHLLSITDRVFRRELPPIEDVDVVFTRATRAA